MMSIKPDITLSNGRVVIRTLEPNGSWLASMQDGGATSEAEWQECCAAFREENDQQRNHARLH